MICFGYPKAVGRYDGDARGSAMAWLLKDGEVLASCEGMFAAPLARLPIGSPVGAQLIQAKRVHFAGTRGADVVALDAGRVVQALFSLGPWRPIFIKRPDTMLVVAERGAIARWGLELGDRLEVR